MKFLPPCSPLDKGPIGIYMHIPFCDGRCRYCAFVTYPYDSAFEYSYVQALKREIQLWEGFALRGSDPIPLIADTVYFGGGTPSLFSPQSIAGLIEECRARFSMADDAEVTMEVNPGSVTRSALVGFQAAGVNRVSLGIQSLKDAELSAMGRRHTAAQALAAYRDLRAAGFDNVSVDLIAGFPGQTLLSVQANLDKILNLQPDHVSIYLLEVKSGTSLDTMIRSGEIPAPDEDLIADMYEMIGANVASAGYQQYEISNFARTGHACRHNLKYWQDAIYLGLGPGAHGMTGQNRYANVESVAEYESMLRQNRLPFASVTKLNEEVRFREALIMGMRLTEGVNLRSLGERYCMDAEAFVAETIGDLQEAGLFLLEDQLLRLTPRGRLLSNVIFSRWV
jgi:oxygen-independent coproporphyrinogen III oxidase